MRRRRGAPAVQRRARVGRSPRSRPFALACLLPRCSLKRHISATRGTPLSSRTGTVYRILVSRVKGHGEQVEISRLLSLLIWKGIKTIDEEPALSAQVFITESTVKFGGLFSVKVLSLGPGLGSFENSVVAQGLGGGIAIVSSNLRFEFERASSVDKARCASQLRCCIDA